MKALVGAFKREEVEGSFSVIVKTDGSFAALVCTRCCCVLEHYTTEHRVSPLQLQPLLLLLETEQPRSSAADSAGTSTLEQGSVGTQLPPV